MRNPFVNKVLQNFGARDRHRAEIPVSATTPFKVIPFECYAAQVKKTFLQKLRAILEADPDLRLAFVYGSFARGKETAASDLDLAVAFSEALTPERRIELAQSLGKKIGREVDLVDLRSARGLIIEEAISHGKLLINRDPLLYAGIMKRMWFDRADFYPLRERILETRRRRAFGSG